MRIITGLARGRKLKEPKGMDIRPTADMIKEAIFNIIQFDIEGRRVLDLFAGTGQLGIEALSRGASACVFVDESRDAVALVKDNLKRLDIPGGTVMQTEALGYLTKAEKFDLIFIDPPYDSGLLEKSLSRIFQFDILSEGGIIICESQKKWPERDASPPYTLKRAYAYGKVKLTVYTREGDAAK